MTLDLMKQKIKGHSFCGCSLQKGRFFVAVNLRHILFNKRSDDDVVDAAVFDLDAVFDHLRHGFRPQIEIGRAHV